MESVIVILAVVALVLSGFFAFRVFGASSEKTAKGVVKEFISAMIGWDRKTVIDLLYPPFRDTLVSDIKFSIPLTELKPSDPFLLSCILYSMAEKIEDTEILHVRNIDDKHAEVAVKATHKNGTKKILHFMTIKNGNKWKIANISEVK